VTRFLPRLKSWVSALPLYDEPIDIVIRDIWKSSDEYVVKVDLKDLVSTTVKGETIEDAKEHAPAVLKERYVNRHEDGQTRIEFSSIEKR